jgi:hypothetical protein
MFTNMLVTIGAGMCMSIVDATQTANAINAAKPIAKKRLRRRLSRHRFEPAVADLAYEPLRRARGFMRTDLLSQRKGAHLDYFSNEVSVPPIASSVREGGPIGSTWLVCPKASSSSSREFPNLGTKHSFLQIRVGEGFIRLKGRFQTTHLEWQMDATRRESGRPLPSPRVPPPASSPAGPRASGLRQGDRCQRPGRDAGRLVPEISKARVSCCRRSGLRRAGIVMW